MTSSNGSIFHVTGPLYGKLTSYRPVNSPHKDQWLGALMFSLICTWINGWGNNREAGDLRRHRAHYDVFVMRLFHTYWSKHTSVRCRHNAQYNVIFHTGLLWLKHYINQEFELTINIPFLKKYIWENWPHYKINAQYYPNDSDQPWRICAN